MRKPTYRDVVCITHLIIHPWQNSARTSTHSHVRGHTHKAGRQAGRQAGLSQYLGSCEKVGIHSQQALDVIGRDVQQHCSWM